MLTISTRVHRFDELRAIVEAHDNVFCSIGTHPHNAAEEPDVTVEDLVALARHPKVRGDPRGRARLSLRQQPARHAGASFRTHIAAARETQLPLVIHARAADADIARILIEETEKGAFPFVLHCFTSGAELACTGLALGGYVSFSGVVTFKNAESLRDIARAVPDDRLLIETDAPYLAPVPMRGKINEPAFVAHTAAQLAVLKGVSEPNFARLTTDNFFRLFEKVPRAALKARASAA